MSIRVLIADDEPLSANEIRRMLGAQFYVTAHAITADDAVGKALKDPPDLLLIDLQIDGEIDGIEATERITGHFNIPVVYLTCPSSPQSGRMLKRAKRRKYYGHLCKPFGEAELHDVIKKAVYKHAMGWK